MSFRMIGSLLIAAAALFWLSWLLMPGVGITDGTQILDLVSHNRASVILSVVTQLLSAALYVPALLGIACGFDQEKVRWGAGLLLLGAMGSAMDAMFHLLAYAMTMPGLERRPLLIVMAFMQGPGLRLVAPFILSFFIGSVLLSVGLRKAMNISRMHIYPYLISGIVAVLGAVAGTRSFISSRGVGLAALGFVAIGQGWLGFNLWRTSEGNSGGNR